jgi:exonuclease SbcD
MIFYTGSLQRLDFNEENQKKGFFVLDVSNNDTTYTYHEVNSQLFYTLNLNTVGMSDSFDYVKKMIDTNRVKDAIVRIKLETDSASKLTTSQEKDIYEYLQSLCANTILNIQQKITDNEKVRNAAITEYVSMDKGLELYFDNQPRKEERIKLGKKILDMVNTND